jgi:hypothetical protein
MASPSHSRYGAGGDRRLEGMGKRTLWLDALPEREVVSRDGCSHVRVDERGRSFLFMVVAAFGTLAALAAPVLLSEREAPILVGAGPCSRPSSCTGAFAPSGSARPWRSIPSAES